MDIANSNIVLCFPAEERHVERISQVASGANVINAGQEGVAEQLLHADIFCGHAKVPVPWSSVAQVDRLKWIQSSAAGLDHCLVPEVVQSEILVTSASGVLANQVSEQMIALLAGLVRGIPQFVRAASVQEFIRRPTGDLHGARIGIVGLGGVGRRVAEVLSVFHPTILATDWFPQNKPAHVASLMPADALDDMLRQVDILILCAPLTPQTRGMINAEKLALLPQGALLINVARGALVVESDLVDALESGHLAGAAMDVTEIEPLPPGSRLWQLPNVLITPHVGGQTARRLDEITDFFCDNLRRYQAREPLLNLVDKSLGFPYPENRFSASAVASG